MSKERKITITIDGLKDGQETIEQLDGAIILYRTDDGAGRAVVGNLSVRDMAFMFKTITAGDNELTKRIIMAKEIADIMPEFDPDDCVELVDNPFLDFMKEMKGHE